MKRFGERTMLMSREGRPLPDLPVGWTPILESLDGYAAQRGRLRVIVSADAEADGRIWWHISVSTTSRKLASWDDVKEVKRAFLGDNRVGLMVLPRKEDYVNIAEVHHIWHCVDGDVTPDFTQGTGSI